MGSESLVRNYFQVVVRAAIGLYVWKVSRILNNRGMRYRATNMSTLAYMGVAGALFKSAVFGVRKSSPLSFSGVCEG